MLYTTHLFSCGYFHTKTEMIAVIIMEVIERIRQVLVWIKYVSESPIDNE